MWNKGTLFDRHNVFVAVNDGKPFRIILQMADSMVVYHQLLIFAGPVGVGDNAVLYIFMKLLLKTIGAFIVVYVKVLNADHKVVLNPFNYVFFVFDDPSLRA
jgi:hypothetical protein